MILNGEKYIQFDTYNPEDEILPEENTSYFIVNTNKTYMPNVWEDMLNDCSTGKAAAYYDRKYSVCRISKGSRVYLYHTGVGVIASGVATSGYEKADYQLDKDAQPDKDAEFFVPLKFDWAVDESQWDAKVPKAWEINKRLNSSHRFRQTVFAITEDMANAIDCIAKKKSVSTG